MPPSCCSGVENGTLKHLQAFFAPRKVVAKVYQSPELEKAVELGKIDFFFPFLIPKQA